MSRDAEARKAATIRLARELYEAMPGVDAPTANGEIVWSMAEVTKPYLFCMLIAANIVRANCATFK